MFLAILSLRAMVVVCNVASFDKSCRKLSFDGSVVVVTLRVAEKGDWPRGYGISRDAQNSVFRAPRSFTGLMGSFNNTFAFAPWRRRKRIKKDPACGASRLNN